MSYLFTYSVQFRMEQSSILILFASCQQTCMIYIIAVCVQWKAPDDGQGNYPKHIEFHSKNKFEKLVHLTFLLLPTWYTNFLFIYTNYIKLNSSTCFERNPPIIRRSTTQIVHMQPLVSSLSASDRLVQPLRKDYLSGYIGLMIFQTGMR